MAVSVNHLSYVVHGRSILSDVSFTLEQGRITLFIGKSGSGKTTILRALVGLVEPTSGEIVLKNQEKPGLVFQQPELFPHMTVLGNCIHPQIKIQGRGESEARERAYELLQMLQVESVAEHYPSQLSGGQRQRVAIARSLVLGKQVLLFDEPTSALDPFSISAFKKLLDTLKEKNLTMAISTHDLLFIQDYLDRVYLIDHGRVVSFYDCEEGPLTEDHLLHKYLTLSL